MPPANQPPHATPAGTVRTTVARLGGSPVPRPPSAATGPVRERTPLPPPALVNRGPAGPPSALPAPGRRPGSPVVRTASDAWWRVGVRRHRLRRQQLVGQATGARRVRATPRATGRGLCDAGRRHGAGPTGRGPADPTTPRPPLRPAAPGAVRAPAVRRFWPATGASTAGHRNRGPAMPRRRVPPYAATGSTSTAPKGGTPRTVTGPASPPHRRDARCAGPPRTRPRTNAAARCSCRCPAVQRPPPPLPGDTTTGPARLPGPADRPVRAVSAPTPRAVQRTSPLHPAHPMHSAHPMHPARPNYPLRPFDLIGFPRPPRRAIFTHGSRTAKPGRFVPVAPDRRGGAADRSHQLVGRRRVGLLSVPESPVRPERRRAGVGVRAGRRTRTRPRRPAVPRRPLRARPP